MNEPLEQSQVSDSSSQLVFTLVFSHFDPSSSSLPPPLAELYFLSGRLQTVAVVVPASTISAAWGGNPAELHSFCFGFAIDQKNSFPTWWHIELRSESKIILSQNKCQACHRSMAIRLYKCFSVLSTSAAFTRILWCSCVQRYSRPTHQIHACYTVKYTFHLTGRVSGLMQMIALGNKATLSMKSKHSLLITTERRLCWVAETCQPYLAWFSSCSTAGHWSRVSIRTFF